LSLYYLDEGARIRDVGSRAIQFCTEHGIPFYRAFSEICLGWATAENGNTLEGVEHMRAGIDAWCATGAQVMLTVFHVMLADGLSRAGRYDEAFEFVEKSLAASEPWEECHAISDAWRLKGKLHLTSPRPDIAAAEEAFSRAISVARSQEAPTWELRSTVELAALWRDNGRVSEAREMLSAIYSRLVQEPEVGILRKAAVVLSSCR
jgi:predicted ATPase